MSLVFAGITPHPPMLIPAIGKDKLEKISDTKKSLEELEQELYVAKPQVIIIISPHSSIFEDSFSVNAHNHFVSNFEQFGDLVTKKEWTGSPDIAAKISSAAKNTRAERVPVQLTSEERLDHGASVALHYLTDHLPDTKIVPVGYSARDKESHLNFGKLLKDVILSEEKRVAVIASGDLSHCATEAATGGYKKEGADFDAELVKNLGNSDFETIFNMDPELVRAADECGYRSILILSGILKNMNCTFKKYSYEAPFGIGYLVGQFTF